MLSGNQVGNKDGFEIDIIRREQAADDPHPARLGDDEGDFRFSLAPPDSVRFRQWMSELPDRDAKKRRRAALQAAAVVQAIRDALPQFSQG